MQRIFPYLAAICTLVLLEWSAKSTLRSWSSIRPQSQSSISSWLYLAATWAAGGRMLYPSMEAGCCEILSSSFATVFRSIHSTHRKWPFWKVKMYQSRSVCNSNLNFDIYDTWLYLFCNELVRRQNLCVRFHDKLYPEQKSPGHIWKWRAETTIGSILEHS